MKEGEEGRGGGGGQGVWATSRRAPRCRFAAFADGPGRAKPPILFTHSRHRTRLCCAWGPPPRPPSLFFVVVVVARGGTGRNVSGQVNALRCDKSTLRAEPGRNRSAWRSDRDPGLSLPMKLP
ncbi:unnamed protein product [Lampetra planeri]